MYFSPKTIFPLFFLTKKVEQKSQGKRECSAALPGQRECSAALPGQRTTATMCLLFYSSYLKSSFSL
jgi:hypothetical protein